jgi:hypothetical protein
VVAVRTAISSATAAAAPQVAKRNNVVIPAVRQPIAAPTGPLAGAIKPRISPLKTLTESDQNCRNGVDALRAICLSPRHGLGYDDAGPCIRDIRWLSGPASQSCSPRERGLACARGAPRFCMK